MSNIPPPPPEIPQINTGETVRNPQAVRVPRLVLVLVAAGAIFVFFVSVVLLVVFSGLFRSTERKNFDRWSNQEIADFKTSNWREVPLGNRVQPENAASRFECVLLIGPQRRQLKLTSFFDSNGDLLQVWSNYWTSNMQKVFDSEMDVREDADKSTFEFFEQF